MAQTYTGPVRWIVVDDGETAQPVTVTRPGWSIEVVRPEPRWAPGQNTQARNLRVGLERCDPAHPVVFWEDDDYYSPGWLDHLVAALPAAELVGSRLITYYNVATRRWAVAANPTHAAMSCTAIRGEAIVTCREVLARFDSFLDLQLWQAHGEQYLFDTDARVVSIKGQPGRPGIGVGHREKFGRYRDPDGAALRELIGADAEAYQTPVEAAA